MEDEYLEKIRECYESDSLTDRERVFIEALYGADSAYYLTPKQMAYVDLILKKVRGLKR